MVYVLFSTLLERDGTLAICAPMTLSFKEKFSKFIFVLEVSVTCAFGCCLAKALFNVRLHICRASKDKHGTTLWMRGTFGKELFFEKEEGVSFRQLFDEVHAP